LREEFGALFLGVELFGRQVYTLEVELRPDIEPRFLQVIGKSTRLKRKGWTYTDGPARDASDLLNISTTEEIVRYQPKVAIIVVSRSEYICRTMPLLVL